MKKCLSNFDLPNHFFYPAVVRHREKDHPNYYWFAIVQDIHLKIDYPLTEFLTVTSFNERNEVTINSYTELLKLYNDISTLIDIRTPKIVFKEDITLDIFKLHQPDN